ncbi:MAG: hypothetical protein ACRD3B_12285, partial [Candidatus Sulfotelmatobacter sp.]
MKLSGLTLWLGLLPLIFTACATIAPPQPPSLELPKPASDLRATRKGDHVILTWTMPETTTDRQTIRALGVTHICRSSAIELTDCGTPLGEVAASTASASPASSGQKPVVASYTDLLPPDMVSDAPSAAATYAVEIFNRAGRSAGLSNRVRVSLIHTLPAPRDFQAKVTSRGVDLSWSGSVPPSRPNVRYVYRVYRRLQGQLHWALVGEVSAADEHAEGLTDSGINWENTYDYRGEAVTVI